MWLPGLWKVFAKRFTFLVEHGRFGDASRLARLYARMRPTDPAAWLMLRDASLSTGDEAAGVSSLRAGVERNPRSPELLWALGTLLVSQQSDAEARVLFEALRHQYPHRPHGYTGLAYIAVQDGGAHAADELIETARHALNLEDDAEYPVLLSLAKISLGTREGERRAEEFLRVAARQPRRDPVPFLMLAGIYAYTNDMDARRVALLEARRRWGGSEERFVVLQDDYGEAVVESLRNRDSLHRRSE